MINWLRVSIKIMMALLTDYEGCAAWSVAKRAIFVEAKLKCRSAG
jgi:hypothetical protein